MLDARNQSAFNALEQAYLYDIPEYIEEEEYIMCSCCGEEFLKSEIEKLWSGEYCCKDCTEKLYKEGEIAREELEEVYG